MPVGIITKGEKKEKVLLKSFVLVFMLGVVFVILMAFQSLFFPGWFFYVLLFLELVLVYFLIKSFVRSFMKIDEENKKTNKKSKTRELFNQQKKMLEEIRWRK